MQGHKRKLAGLLVVLLVACMLTGCGSGSYSRGSWQDGVFTHNFWGFSFAPPSTWSVESDSTLAKNMGVTEQELNDPKVWEEEATIYEFSVSNSVKMVDLSMTTKNLARSSVGTGISEEEYLTALLQQRIEEDQVNFAQKGEIETVEIAGKKYLKGVISTYQDLVMEDYYVRKQGDKLVILCAYYPGGQEEAVTEALSYFTAL